MNEQQLQQAFIQFLAQKTGAKNQQELESAIQQLGEQGLRQAYQEFLQVMQQQQVQAAKFGAKLDYINQLRGKCPEGYEVEYYKAGGRMCKKCVQKAKQEKTSNPVDEFKCGRKMKKAQGGAIDLEKVKKKELGGDITLNKCGGKSRKTKKKENGGEINSTRNPQVFDKMALAKCGAKLKEACKSLPKKKKEDGGVIPNEESKGNRWKPRK